MRFQRTSAVAPSAVTGFEYFKSSAVSNTISRFWLGAGELGRRTGRDARDEKILGVFHRIGAERAEGLGAEHLRLRTDDDLRVVAAAVEHEDAAGIGAPAVEGAAVLADVDGGGKAPRADEAAGDRIRPMRRARPARLRGIAAAAMPSSAMNSRLSIATPQQSHFFMSCSISRSGRVRELAVIWLQRSIFPGGAGHPPEKWRCQARSAFMRLAASSAASTMP